MTWAWLLLVWLTPYLAIANDVVDRLPFRLKVDLEVAGQPVTIDRVVECRGVLREHPGPDSEQAGKPLFSTMKRRVVWERFPRAIFQVLPSREMITVYVPSVCDPWSKRLKPLPAGYIPALEWWNDADDLKEREIYVSPGYFDHAAARVKFKGIRVERTPQSETYRSGRTPSWSTTYEEAAQRALVYAFARHYPKKEWMALPEQLKGFAKARDVLEVTDPEISRALRLLGYSRYAHFDGLGVNARVQSNRRGVNISPGTGEVAFIQDDVTRPLVLDNSSPIRFRFADTIPGFERYVQIGEDFPRGKVPDNFDLRRKRYTDIEVEYRDRVYRTHRGELIVFDPQSQEVIYFRTISMLLRRGD